MYVPHAMMVADRGLRLVIALLLLIATSAMWQPHVAVATAEQPTTQLTLYAHTDPSATQVEGRVLSLSGNATSPHYADVRDGLAFVLLPALSALLHILGTFSIYVWLKCPESVRGTLEVTLSEVYANASLREMRSSSVTTGLSPYPFLVIFGLGAADYTLDVGSTLKFEVRFSPVRSVPVMLLWDDPATPTRLIMQVESLPKITFTVTNIDGKASTVFPENDTSTTRLVAKVTVEDPFRGTNVRSVLLNVTNSTGFSVIEDAPMNLTSRVELPFHLGYTLPMALSSGRFNVTVSVRDAGQRNFLNSIEITVTRFYTLVLLLVDAHGTALPGLNVSVTALSRPIEESTTNSTGWTSIRVPSSEAVGPLTLQVRYGTLVIPLRSIEVESDSAAIITVPLYDWAIFVRLQSLGTPVVAARVDLYLNDTFVTSALTDANGAAHFKDVPLGEYEVAVTSPLAFKQFVNVTHSAELKETGLVLPFPPVLVLVAAIAIVVVLGIFAAKRRRVRRFKHVGELIGGSIPRPAVTMIVGPSGSGKSLLLQNLLADFLGLGRRCVYVSNCELPSKVKERLGKMGIDVRKLQDSNMLGFVDAYSGATGAVSSEKYSVPSARDLTRLGTQLTSCLEELGEPGDVFFDSLTPMVAPGAFERGFDFIEYYGARTKNSGGTFLYVASTTIEPELLSRLEELADFVFQTEKYAGRGGIRGRLLVKKARDVQHEAGWFGFSIRSDARMEFASLPPETP
jgi:KaiC/GvpD/RAD55 family RecA-like ATPase